MNTHDKIESESRSTFETVSYPSADRCAMYLKILIGPDMHSMEVEGWLNTGFEKHLKVCKTCRDIVVKDLRDFAQQIESGT